MRNLETYTDHLAWFAWQGWDCRELAGVDIWTRLTTGYKVPSARDGHMLAGGFATVAAEGWEEYKPKPTLEPTSLDDAEHVPWALHPGETRKRRPDVPRPEQAEAHARALGHGREVRGLKVNSKTVTGIPHVDRAIWGTVKKALHCFNQNNAGAIDLRVNARDLAGVLALEYLERAENASTFFKGVTANGDSLAVAVAMRHIHRSLRPAHVPKDAVTKGARVFEVFTDEDWDGGEGNLFEDPDANLNWHQKTRDPGAVDSEALTVALIQASRLPADKQEQLRRYIRGEDGVRCPDLKLG